MTNDTIDLDLTEVAGIYENAIETIMTREAVA